MGNVKPGDGTPLRPVKGLQWLWRGQFGVELGNTAYVLDVDYFDLQERGFLYEHGQQVAVAALPAKFPVPGGRIEADMSLYGMKRAHLVTAEGTQQLSPSPGTAERWRTNLDRDRPVTSRALTLTSTLILLVALGLEVPQLIEILTGNDWFESLAGWSFTATFDLPVWVNAVVGVAGVVAALERALRLQHNSFLDV